MPEIVSEQDGKVIGITLRNELTNESLQDITDFLSDRIHQHGSIRLLFEMAGVRGADAPELIRGLDLDFPRVGDVERVAIVGDETWEKWLGRIDAYFEGAELQYYNEAHLAEAWSWLTGKV